MKGLKLEICLIFRCEMHFGGWRRLPAHNTNDLEKKLSQLNNSECIPFAFRTYCTFEVEECLTDEEVHNMIETLNYDLKSIETFNGEKITKEFFRIEPEKVYEILKSIASAAGSIDRVKRIPETIIEKKDQVIATEMSNLL